ncbi:hypothetical protein PCASD_06149 [Puccinia coronata f. sp. avenae]|uniref:Uncharacterized protein n=1 Tax=Puccinia coronata f. sp. avenae TaxID=200324 RepID=A0A2N5V004_9BASI|nr:hypothetical protein PCASD_06149 [Puccinia coronata f. sp. avenae]
MFVVRGTLEVCLHLQRYLFSLSWYKYQPSEQADLLAELVPVPAQQASLPAREAGNRTSPAARLTCSLGWYRYQLGEPVDLPAGLVGVPGQRAGQTVSPLRASGPGPSRSMLEGFWIGKQADLLAGLVEVPARRAGQPAHWAGTGISSGKEVKLLVGLAQVPARQPG